MIILFHPDQGIYRRKFVWPIKQAVIADMGISFLLAHTISQESQAGTLRALSVKGSLFQFRKVNRPGYRGGRLV